MSRTSETISRWKYTIPKEDFKRRMRDGDIDKDIEKANEMIREEEDESSSKSKWLLQHICSLNNAKSQVIDDDEERSKFEFIDKNFDVRRDPYDNVEMPEPDKD